MMSIKSLQVFLVGTCIFSAFSCAGNTRVLSFGMRGAGGELQESFHEKVVAALDPELTANLPLFKKTRTRDRDSGAIGGGSKKAGLIA